MSSKLLGLEGKDKKNALLLAAGAVGVGLGGYILWKWSKSKTGATDEEKPVDDHEALKVQGNERFKQKDYAGAVEMYTKAIELKPDNHVLYSNRAIALCKLNKFQEALEDATKTIQLAPSFARGFERLANALIGLERYGEAMNVMQQCVILDPSRQQNAAFRQLVNETAMLLQEQHMRLQRTNCAFVFIKPHAVTDATKALVEATFKDQNITILSQGCLTGEEIDEKKLIDQHYYAIASKATILKPSELNVPADKFEEKFGLSWSDALEGGRVFNAMDACSELGVDADRMNTLWAECKAAGKMIKFGGGFYCGVVEVEGHEPAYVFNGFFMSMRSKFTVPGSQIHYYVVQWSVEGLSWSDFRAKVLGPTDPADAPAESLRGKILAQWQELGLAAEPDTGDNGVHASASPFEGLAERLNWLKADVMTDPFGQLLLAAGMHPDMIGQWSLDPQVKLPSGAKGSLFDALEDLDAGPCMMTCANLAAANVPA